MRPPATRHHLPGRRENRRVWRFASGGRRRRSSPGVEGEPELQVLRGFDQRDAELHHRATGVEVAVRKATAVAAHEVSFLRGGTHQCTAAPFAMEKVAYRARD